MAPETPSTASGTAVEKPTAPTATDAAEPLDNEMQVGPDGNLVPVPKAQFPLLK